MIPEGTSRGGRPSAEKYTLRRRRYLELLVLAPEAGVGERGQVHDREKPRPLGRGLALGVQGGGSGPARGWGESPILGIELSAEGARAKLWRTSDGRVY